MTELREGQNRKVPHAGPISSAGFQAELRWSLAQVAFLHHLEERSDERLQVVRERVQHLGYKAQYVPLRDREARTQLVRALSFASNALRYVRDLQENDARHRIKEAEDRLISALRAFGCASAGE